MEGRGNSYSLTSSIEGVATVTAAAAITFLPILTVLFFLVVLSCKEEPMKELAAIRNIKMSSFLKLKVKTRCCTCTCDGDRTQTEQLWKKRSTHEDFESKSALKQYYRWKHSAVTDNHSHSRLKSGKKENSQFFYKPKSSQAIQVWW